MKTLNRTLVGLAVAAALCLAPPPARAQGTVVSYFAFTARVAAPHIYCQGSLDPNCSVAWLNTATWVRADQVFYLAGCQVVLEPIRVTMGSGLEQTVEFDKTVSQLVTPYNRCQAFAWNPELLGGTCVYVEGAVMSLPSKLGNTHIGTTLTLPGNC